MPITTPVLDLQEVSKVEGYHEYFIYHKELDIYIKMTFDVNGIQIRLTPIEEKFPQQDLSYGRNSDKGTKRWNG